MRPAEPPLGPHPQHRHPSPPQRWWLAALLFFATVGTTTGIGALIASQTQLGLPADSTLWLSLTEIRRVWSDPRLLRLGLSYSLPLLFILLCHEFGHYFACRHYRLPATPPMFLPLPLGLGTLGAFIRIRAPIRRRRALFDIGVAGPLAGFVALVPFLLWGIAHSDLETLTMAEDPETGTARVGLGRSLAMSWAIRAFHGTLAPDQALDLHPVALAAWVGLLATALNLLPLGQLDGGHLLYAAIGGKQRRWAPVLLLALALGGLLWPVWWLWCVFILLTGLRHPPVRDERAPLGRGRWLLTAATVGVFVLCFMPVPVGVFFLAAP